MNVLLWRIHSGRPSEKIQVQNTKPPFYLKTIEALLRRNAIEVELVDSQNPQFPSEYIYQLLKIKSPEVIIIEGTLFDLPAIQSFGNFLAHNHIKAKIVVIGQVASALPDEIVKPFQEEVFVIGGEPEGIIQESIIADWPVMNFHLLRQKSYNLSNKQLIRHQYEDFRSSPAIRYSAHEVPLYQYNFPLKSHKKLIWGHVMATRGCPHHCTFCTNLIRESYGSKMRTKKVEVVLDEIRNLLSQGVNAIAFGDDDITADSTYLAELCSGIIAEKLNFIWTAHVRIDECSEELLFLMKQSGCSLLRFGLESGSEKVLRYYQKNRITENWWKQAKHMLMACRKFDIQTCGLFILGSPQDSFSTHLATLKAALFSGLDLVQLHFFTPYEGTVEARRLKVSIPVSQDHYSWNFKNFSKASTFQIRFFYLLIYALFYFSPSRILRMIKNYTGFFLSNRLILKNLCKSYFLVMTQGVRIWKQSA